MNIVILQKPGCIFILFLDLFKEIRSKFKHRCNIRLSINMTGNMLIARLGDQDPAYMHFILSPEGLVFKKAFPDKTNAQTAVLLRLRYGADIAVTFKITD